MRMNKLRRAVGAAKRIVAPRCRGRAHGRFQYIENRRGGVRVQMCARCGKPVGQPLPAERREFRRVA